MTLPNISLLLETAVTNRDVAWEFAFLRALANSSVRVIEDTPVNGPDGWPYLMVATDGDCDQSMGDVARWLVSRGVGMVVNPEKSIPDFVVTYGMVWNFRDRGEFLTQQETTRSVGLDIHDGQQLYTGVPSHSYLPEDVRLVLREFFKRQKVFEPRTLMISTDQINWDLGFSIESMGAPPKNEHSGIAEALGWFLPSHYSLALVSEKNVPGFVSL